VTTPQSQDNKHWLFVGKFVNGFVYWMYAEEACMHAHAQHHHTALHFSQMDLPLYLKGQTHMYIWSAKTKDGGLCIVVAIEFKLYVWLRDVCC
jgi:hypothetical protein